MTPKEYLGIVWNVDKQIEAKLSLIGRLRDLAVKCTASISEMPGGGENTLDDTIAKIVDAERELDAMIDRLIDLKRERMKAIESIENTEYRLILTKRYLCGERWEQIAVDLGHDLRWVYRLHGKALAEIKKFHQATKSH